MEQLKQTLSEAVKIGFSYRFICNNQSYEFKCLDKGIRNGERYEDEEIISYHELLSKDSGLMEFMEWNNKSDRKIPEIDKYVIRYLYDPDYVYKKMGPMTKKEKIDYFNTYACLPNEMP